MQDPEAILRAATMALQGLLPPSPPGETPALPAPLPVALTTQRDTLLLVDAGGGPLTPLLSWREREHIEDPGRRGALLGDADLDGASARPLERWLADALAALFAPRPGPAARPVLELIHAGGDKNCEYLALGASPGRPDLGALSLGSAIALGVAVGSDRPRPMPRPGVVVSRAAGSPPLSSPGSPTSTGRGWNVETGILSGMEGMALSSGLFGSPPHEGPLPTPPAEPRRSRLRVVPHFGGALDDPGATARILVDPPSGPPRPFDPAFGDAAPTPDEVALAWARGVAFELARLRPVLEAVSGTPLRQVRVGGGGLGGEAGGRAWMRVLEEALHLPIEIDPDPWAGCRGAVLALGHAVEPARRNPAAAPDSETSTDGGG